MKDYFADMQNNSEVVSKTTKENFGGRGITFTEEIIANGGRVETVAMNGDTYIFMYDKNDNLIGMNCNVEGKNFERRW